MREDETNLNKLWANVVEQLRGFRCLASLDSIPLLVHYSAVVADKPSPHEHSLSYG